MSYCIWNPKWIKLLILQISLPSEQKTPQGRIPHFPGPCTSTVAFVRGGGTEATGLGFVFCRYQPSCAVSQQSWFWAFLFHTFSNFTPPPPDSVTFQGFFFFSLNFPTSWISTSCQYSPSKFPPFYPLNGLVFVFVFLLSGFIVFVFIACFLFGVSDYSVRD